MKTAIGSLLVLVLSGNQFAQEKMVPKDDHNKAAVEVSFRLGGPSKPVALVPTLVNGKGPYQFALDTGAGQTVVSSELANELGLKQGEKKEALGAGGKLW